VLELLAADSFGALFLDDGTATEESYSETTKVNSDECPLSFPKYPAMAGE
jgi:hypothetical protein